MLRAVAMASFGSVLPVSTQAAAAETGEKQQIDKLEEIVVTASKTGENIRAINGGVGSVSGDGISELGAQSAEGYLQTVPGVVFNAQNAGNSTVVIRGVGTSVSANGSGQASTGSYINDVPLTDPFFSVGIPDINAFDVDNVEVYRGPQGTLFGAASLGGAVNYIAKRPTLGAFDGTLETIQSVTSESDDLNSSYNVMLNAPLGDRLATRIVGTYRQDSGFIDNAGTGQKDSNQSEIQGGRIQFLLDAWQGAEVEWLTLYQQSETADFGYRNPDLGDLLKSTLIPDQLENDILLHSLRLNQNLGWATLTGIASYSEKSMDAQADAQRFGALGFVTPSFRSDGESEAKSYELRLRGGQDSSFAWLIGAMYSDTTQSVREEAFAENAGDVADALLGPGGGAIATIGDSWGFGTNQFNGVEQAVFGQATIRLTQRLAVTLGGRLFKTESDSNSTTFGLLNLLSGAPLSTSPPTVRQEEDGFNPSLSVSYDLSDNVRFYTTASKGFRFGGGNVNPDPSLPRVFDSDELWNYEIGVRSDLFDDTLRFDATVYHIDWSDIPLQVVTGTGAVGTINAGNAEIDGVEIGLTWRLNEKFSFESAITYTDATLVSVTQTAGVAFSVTSGTQLPGSSDWLLSNTLRYVFDGVHRPFLQLAHRHASEAPAVLTRYAPPGRNATVGNYDLFDLRAGFDFGPIEIAAFVNNLTDERAVLSASYLNPPLADEIQQYVARPRTLGVSLGWSF